MLIQLLLNQPEVALTIVQRTPHWVWGLLAGLVLLGLAQLRTRHLTWRRAVAPAIGLALFGLSGLARDLSSTPWLASGLLVWMAAAAALMLLASHAGPRPGTRYDLARDRFVMPGSVMPLLTILAIFLLKYGIGVELAMQPQLRQDALFALPLAAAYGALTGLFGARPMALWHLARPQRPVSA